MIEQREGPAEQQQEPEPGTKEVLHAFKGLGPRSGGDQPPDEQNRAGAQHYPGGPVEDRQYGGELPAIDLKVRRKRPVGGSHATAIPALPPPLRPRHKIAWPGWRLGCELDRAPKSVNGSSCWLPRAYQWQPCNFVGQRQHAVRILDMQVLDQPAVDEHHPPTRSGGFGMRRNDPPRPFDFRWGRRKSGVS